MASLNPRTGVLGKRLAAHLLRRATFNFSKSRIDDFSLKTAQQAVLELTNLSQTVIPEPLDHASGTTFIGQDPRPANTSAEFYLRQWVQAWWLNEAKMDESIGHKMQFFLHSIWIIHTDSGKSDHFWDYLKLIKMHALGSYRELAYHMTLDNLMLIYLDNTYNRKNNPNENYARELLELFTMGVGNYDDVDDIAAAAEVLTGFYATWDRSNVNPNTGIPAGKTAFWDHTTTDKTFSSQYFGGTVITAATNDTDMYRELNDFLDMIFAQSATAEYISRKMYRFFVSNKISTEVENDIIQPLATMLRANNYNLLPVVTALLESQHFYDEDDAVAGDEIIGALIRSPLELSLQSFNYFDLQVPDYQTDTVNHYDTFYKNGVLYDMFYRSGFEPFRTHSPAGYEAYYQRPDYARNWFNSSTLLARYKTPEMLLTGKRYNSNTNPIAAQFDVVDYVQQNVSNPGSVYALVTELTDYLFCELPDNDRLNYFMDDVFLQGGVITAADWTTEWNDYLSTGDRTGVEPALKHLFEGIMFSPEYQLF